MVWNKNDGVFPVKGYYSRIYIKYRDGSIEYRAVRPIEFRIENMPRDIIEWALP